MIRALLDTVSAVPCRCATLCGDPNQRPHLLPAVLRNRRCFQHAGLWFACGTGRRLLRPSRAIPSGYQAYDALLIRLIGEAWWSWACWPGAREGGACLLLTRARTTTPDSHTPARPGPGSDSYGLSPHGGLPTCWHRARTRLASSRARGIMVIGRRLGREGRRYGSAVPTG